jgi:hypothetical protein
MNLLWLGNFVMNKLLLSTAAIAASMAVASPAQAATILLGVFSGNDCQGGFSSCFATQTGINVTGGALPSSAVIKFNGNEQNLTLDEVSSNFGTVTGSEFSRSFNATTNVFSFTYTAGAGDPALHYFAIKQGQSYALYYDAVAITAGSVDLDIAFGGNTDDFSHVTFFNSSVPAVPEPGTWAMLILGFGMVGGALRAARKQRPVLNYV